MQKSTKLIRYNVEKADFIELLDILQKKGYITYAAYSMPVIESKPKERFLYSEDNDVSIKITLTGKFFRQQEGFQDKEKGKNQDKTRLRKHDAQIIRLTFILAFGAIIAAVYYFIEILKEVL